MKEMNEKLKQLYLCSFAPSISDSAVCEEGAKKFAELMHDECIDAVPTDLDPATYFKVLQAIKEHFGF